MAVVTSFVLTPYTSFWQPQAPTYNPVEAYFQLSHPRVNGGEQPYYESPYFRVEDVMKVRSYLCVAVIVILSRHSACCHVAELPVRLREWTGETDLYSFR